MDYNIYIHDKTSSKGGSSNTKGWTDGNNSQTSANTSNENIPQVISRTASIFNNPDSLISGAIGVVAKASPYIVAAYVAVSTSARIAQEQVNYVARETGDYRESLQWSNAMATISALFKPFSTVKSLLENRQEVSLYNRKIEQERMLIGESITNGATRRV